jgi:demethoxyubiquinone hydroxylase (CLK1/Coq7/Cat5 family)
LAALLACSRKTDATLRSVVARELQRGSPCRRVTLWRSGMNSKHGFLSTELTMQVTTNNENKQTVDQLNSFLRGELSATETYRLALSKLPTSPNRPVLEQCARSHEYRVRLITDEIHRLGGTPSDDSGAWGTFAKLIESGAQLFGENTAVAALEQGEDYGKSDYDRDLSKLERSARSLIESKVKPEQIRTHMAMSLLKNSLAS